MAKEPYTHHIQDIFSALDVGLDGLTELTSNSYKSVDYVPPHDDHIDPDRFNRATVTIDGESYTVSIFRTPKTREQQSEESCPRSPTGKHVFSSQGCPAAMQACIHCEEIEL